MTNVLGRIQPDDSVGLTDAFYDAEAGKEVQLVGGDDHFFGVIECFDAEGVFGAALTFAFFDGISPPTFPDVVDSG